MSLECLTEGLLADADPVGAGSRHIRVLPYLHGQGARAGRLLMHHRQCLHDMPIEILR